MTTGTPSSALEIVQSSLRAHQKLPVFSDQLAQCTSLYMDTGHLSDLDSGNWQRVHGRPGTGKTFLLRTFVESIVHGVRTDHLAVYVRSGDVMANYDGTDPSHIALSCFHLLLEQIQASLLQARATAPPRTPRRYRREYERARETIDKAMSEVIDLVTRGRSVAPVKDSLVHEETVVADSNKLSGGVSAEASSRAPFGALKVHGSGEAERSREVRRTYSSSQHLTPRYPEARAVLEKMIVDLGAKRLMIAIDDWDQIDPGNARGVQGAMFRLLHTAWWGSSHISVKIGAVRYDTRTVDAEGKGLNIDTCTEELVNLDRAFFESRDLLEYFESLLFRRLLMARGEAGLLLPNGEDVPEDFVEFMFESRDVFQRLILMVEAVPAQFVATIRALAKASGYRCEPRWNLNDVEAAAAAEALTAMDIARASASTAVGFLTGRCKQQVTANGNPTFLIAVGDKNVDAWQREYINPLLQSQLVHQIEQADLPPGLRTRYWVYRVSKSVWLDWERALESAQGQESSMRAYEADLATVERDPLRYAIDLATWPTDV